MFPRYLQYLLTDFRQTFVTGAPRHRDELIRFWGQKVKVQGHGMISQIFMFPLYPQYLSIDFRQTFVIGASWDTDDLITFLGPKGQSSRSHHRGGGAQHSTLPSSATIAACHTSGLWRCQVSGKFRNRYRYVNYQRVSLNTLSSPYCSLSSRCDIRSVTASLSAKPLT